MSIVREWQGAEGSPFVEVACDRCDHRTVKRSFHAKRAKVRSQHLCRACNNSVSHKAPSAETRALISQHVRETMARPEVRKRISEAQPDQSGERNAFFGRRHTEATKEKLRANNPFKGACNPWWKPWMAERRKDWGDQIRRMFGGCCAWCGRSAPELKFLGLKLDAHHVVPASSQPDLRYDLNNGVALCREHHTEAHRILRRDPDRYKLEIQALQSKRAGGETPDQTMVP